MSTPDREAAAQTTTPAADAAAATTTAGPSDAEVQAAIAKARGALARYRFMH